MKTEHEKLKEICDKIKFSYEKYHWNDEFKMFCIDNRYYTDVFNVREIIFTQEFWTRYCDATWFDVWEELEDHLDNPIDYLYNLIKE